MIIAVATKDKMSLLPSFIAILNLLVWSQISSRGTCGVLHRSVDICNGIVRAQFVPLLQLTITHIMDARGILQQGLVS